MSEPELISWTLSEKNNRTGNWSDKNKKLSRKPVMSRVLETPKEYYDDKPLKEVFSNAFARFQECKNSTDTKRLENLQAWVDNSIYVDILGKKRSIREIVLALEITDIKNPHMILDGKKIAVEHRSYLAKLIQMFSVAHGNPVFFKDKQPLEASIDGNIGRFTIQALASMKKSIETGNASRKTDWLKSGYYDSMREVKSAKGKIQTERSESFKYNPLSNAVEMGSYGITSKLIVGGENPLMYVQIPGLSEEPYPFAIPLGINKETGEVLMDSDMNKQNLKNAYKICNFVHFVLKEYVLSSKYKDKWLVNPFNVSFIRENIEFSTGWVNFDDKVITNNKLANFQFNAAEGNPVKAIDSRIGIWGLRDVELKKEKVNAKTMTNFLNAIFSKVHAQKIVAPTPIVEKI